MMPPVAALEPGDAEDVAALEVELDAEAPAVLDEEQAAREPATAIAMQAVITVRRVVEERATLILPGVDWSIAAAFQGSVNGPCEQVPWPRSTTTIEPVRWA